MYKFSIDIGVGNITQATSVCLAFRVGQSTAHADSPDHGELRPPAAPAPISWARLLKRVMEIHIAQCPQCGSTLTSIAPSSGQGFDSNWPDPG